MALRGMSSKILSKIWGYFKEFWLWQKIIMLWYHQIVFHPFCRDCPVKQTSLLFSFTLHLYETWASCSAITDRCVCVCEKAYVICTLGLNALCQINVFAILHLLCICHQWEWKVYTVRRTEIFWFIYKGGIQRDGQREWINGNVEEGNLLEAR